MTSAQTFRVVTLGWIVLLFAWSSKAQTKRAYDVVIAGAGSGGTAAAIQAARMGMNVALLEETDYLGGQMGSAGVSSMDEGNNLTPPSGFYREFLARMESYYLARGQSVGTCYWADNSHCFEPVGVKRVLQAMIDEVNSESTVNHGRGHIDLFLRDRIVKVQSEGKRVVGEITLRGKIFQSRILIDATEFGDVLPLTPARFRSGNRVGNTGPDVCTQSITYTMVIKKYPGGVPKELQMTTPPPGYDRYVDGFRHALQKDGNPANRYLPVNFAIHNAYRGMPDPGSANYTSTQASEVTKTSLNWFNDYPADTGIFDRARRSTYVCAAKLKTIANLYYIQHELGETLWSVANDQEYDTPYNREENSCPNIPAEFKAIERNMPESAYVRESQRIIGKHVLLGAEIRRESQGGLGIKSFPSAIAVGDYADDLHGCNTESTLEPELDRRSDNPPGFRSGPFQVPFGVLIPESTEGMLAAEKNISASRLANGATRLQPITMLTGQAAGILAALSIRANANPRLVYPEAVQVELLRAGAILSAERIEDVPEGTAAWQATQLAVARGWMHTHAGRFEGGSPMSRADMVETLALVYVFKAVPSSYRTPQRLKSSFEDLPLYSHASDSAEALLAKGVDLDCVPGKHLFCEDKPATVSEFSRIVNRLDELRGGQNTTARVPAASDPSVVLTRQVAAGILLDAVSRRTISK